MSKKVIGFHKPEEPNGYLSNWYMSDFEIEGQHFSSMEQYMMYSKAITFGDSEIPVRSPTCRAHHPISGCTPGSSGHPQRR